MAIAIDSSTPAIVSGTGSTKTTTTFSPPAFSLIVALVAFEQLSGAGTITMSTTGTLSWTNRVARNISDAGGNGGHVAIFTAPSVGAQSGITVTATSAVGSDAGALKVLVITGADLGSVGTNGEGSSTTTNLTVNTAYTSTVNGSRGVAIGNDYQGQGAVTTSGDTGFAYNINTRSSGIAIHKASNTATAGTAVSFNFDGGSNGGRQWNWAALEIKPESQLLVTKPVLIDQVAVQTAAYW